MSTPAQKANLARIRDNQRRSRARKREYLQELEQRLRLCELQGIEASAEVQVAARRVAEENRQLRELLHKQAVTDDYINHYLQASMIAPELNPTLGAGLPGPAVQALQQLLVPRRPNSMDPNASFPMPPSQNSREASIASVSTSTSSLWESPQHAMTSPYSQHHQHHQQQREMEVSGGMATPAGSGQQQYAASMYSGESTPRVDSFSSLRPAQQQQQQQQQHVYSTPQQIQAANMQSPAALGYSSPNVGPYTANPNVQNYGGPGGGGY